MALTCRYCVIIPALNVAETIGALVRQIRAHGFEPIVVNDGSRDRTAVIASQAGALVISHLRTLGKGCALRTGFAFALKAQYDGVVTMDGDGQHDPTEIGRLIRIGERRHAGVVVGYRRINGDSMPRIRRWTNRLMSAIVSLLTRQPIPDSQCGFRFIRKEVLERVPLRATRFEVETELVVRAAAQRWKIVSVPIQSIYHAQHRSHIRPLRDAVRFLGLLLRHLVGR
jgi:glycosyltransferase involved in cell wall biosynthesis